MAEVEMESDWSPIKSFNNHSYKVSDGGDHVGAGCMNIAKAILYGLTYIGDCIKDSNKAIAKAQKQE